MRNNAQNLFFFAKCPDAIFRSSLLFQKCQAKGDDVLAGIFHGTAAGRIFNARRSDVEGNVVCLASTSSYGSRNKRSSIFDFNDTSVMGILSPTFKGRQVRMRTDLAFAKDNEGRGHKKGAKVGKEASPFAPTSRRSFGGKKRGRKGMKM